MRYKIIVITIFIILLSSCSFLDDKEKSDIIEHPDIILLDATYVVNREGNTKINLSSSQIEIFNRRNLTTAEQSTFNFVDKSGKVIIEGSCEEISINTKTNDVELNGNVYFKILDPVLEISCDSLSWSNKQNIISTNDNDVNVKSDVGLFIGSGLSLNIDTRYFEFKEITKGELY